MEQRSLRNITGIIKLEEEHRTIPTVCVGPLWDDRVDLVYITR